MNWDDLKIFLDASRHRRLEDVATQTQLDPTTISRRLKRLEQTLGMILFERTRHGHRLTPSGEHLAATVEAMESVSFDIKTQSEIESSAAGRIRLGVTEGLGTAVIAPAVANFRALHPSIDLDVIALSGFVSVPKREADMSILLTRPTTGRLKVKKLTDYSLNLYGAQSYIETQPTVWKRGDLHCHTLIGYVPDLIYSAQLEYFKEVLPELNPQLCSPSIVAQLEMVLSGVGLGILPAFMAKRHAGLVRLLPQEISVSRSFWLAVHEDLASLTRIKLMINFLNELISGLP